MTITLLKGKIHRAVVTGADLNYEGSISICPDLLAAAGFIPWEKVEIYNINTGARFSTYIILGQMGEIGLNGAAARLVQKGDLVIIAAYCSMDAKDAEHFSPKVVLVDSDNKPVPVVASTKGGASLQA